jgi:probable phosphoglycerate mutase
MEKTLVIVRHGNTFAPGETPTRVGASTDIPLVEEHKSRNAAKYLLHKGVVPDRIFAAPLKRTMQSANLIIDEMKLNTVVIPDNRFTEIDYGEDENRTEEQVQYRLGREYAANNGLSGDIDAEKIKEYGCRVIELWNVQAIVPTGWNVDIKGIIFAWKSFADSIADNETTLICTSNGIIRFAPHILCESDIEDFRNKHSLKVATGSVSIFKHIENVWKCIEWGIVKR